MDEQDIFHDTLYHVLRVYVIPPQTSHLPRPLRVGKQEGKRQQPCYNRCGQRWRGGSCAYATYEERQE